MSEPVLIVTHCDTFHCDEVTACAMLKYIFGSINVTRTRDPAEIIKLNELGAIVVDVGKVLNPENRQFDHNQEKCVDTYNEHWTIPLSSCGLIFKHYGENIIQKKIGEIGKSIVLDDNQVRKIKNKLYSMFIANIDANDTGVPYIKKNLDCDSVCNYRYQVTFGDIISKMNHKRVFDHETQYQRFMDAVGVAQEVFNLYLTRFVQNELEFAKELLQFEPIFNSPRDCLEILIIDKNFKIRELLFKMDPKQTVKYIIAPRGKNGWQIWTVNKPGKRFDILAPIVSEADAKVVLGDRASDLVFVHANQFIAGFKTQSAAVCVAKHSLEHFYVQKKWKSSIVCRTIGCIQNTVTMKNIKRGGVLTGVLALGVIIGVRLARK